MSLRSAPDALLTRHFLRRFLENDLISPDADRLQLLAVLGAGLISFTLFVSTFLSFKYVTLPLTPGQVAFLSLTDKFFYLGISMVVLALVAVAQWDSLVVDARDAAILEPLPLRPRTIRRAKLAAVAILGGAVAVAVNAAPTLIFPWLMVFDQHVTLVMFAALILTHAAMTLAAAAFAYLAVIAFREGLAFVLGPRVFARVSPLAQGALIVVLGSALLLLPAASIQVASRGLTGWRAMAPPAWFLGAYELAVGHVIADSPRSALTARQRNADSSAAAAYRTRAAQFPQLAGRALTAFVLVCAAAGAAYFGNGRRLSFLAPVASSAHRGSRLAAAIARLVIARNQTVRGGFFFTLAVLWRSNVHRLTIACAAAAGLAMSVIALSGVDLQTASGSATPPGRLLIVQPFLYGVLLVAFRHAIRVPAELKANWGFQLAWCNRDRRFLAGSRRAAIVALALPALAVTLPLVVFVAGLRVGLLHAAFGFGGAIVLLEALLLGYHKVPFTCTYLPDEHAKLIGPVYVVAFFTGASFFARMESAALQSSDAAIRLVLLLIGLFALCRVMSLRTPRIGPMEFNEAPVTTQRLGLHT
jgi:hypothetical protein